ncbi:MAG: hypothetical protein AAB413_00515 [Patescibacteria group bacterium]
MATVIKHLGLTHVLWIVKEGMRKAPVVGGSLECAGHAFVTRARDPQDKERVREMNDWPSSLPGRLERKSLFSFFRQRENPAGWQD